MLCLPQLTRFVDYFLEYNHILQFDCQSNNNSVHNWYWLLNKYVNSMIIPIALFAITRCTKYRRRVCACAAISGQSDKNPSRTP